VARPLRAAPGTQTPAAPARVRTAAHRERSSSAAHFFAYFRRCGVDPGSPEVLHGEESDSELQLWDHELFTGGPTLSTTITTAAALLSGGGWVGGWVLWGAATGAQKLKLRLVRLRLYETKRQIVWCEIKKETSLF